MWAGVIAKKHKSPAPHFLAETMTQPLLSAKCIDRVQLGCASCGIDAKEQAYSGWDGNDTCYKEGIDYKAESGHHAGKFGK